ncbi:MAG: AglZ/HisF2 family acetamidino modification protein [Thermodesulfobacteriota bacterium]
MPLTRVIPCLLLRNRGLVKTVRFKDADYVGDPVNVIRIFNEKEVDELILLDITATPADKKPSFEVVREVAGECFMPLTYGGGVREVEDMRRLLASGVEKVSVNTAAAENPDFIRAAAREFGSQAVVVSMDVKKKLFGRYEVRTHGGRRALKDTPADYARRAQDLGAGEILLTSMDRDGTMDGYDLELIAQVAGAVEVPVVACGGAGDIYDFDRAVHQAGASAAAAGAMVVYQGKDLGVLINFPTPAELAGIFPERINQAR